MLNACDENMSRVDVTETVFQLYTTPPEAPEDTGVVSCSVSCPCLSAFVV